MLIEVLEGNIRSPEFGDRVKARKRRESTDKKNAPKK